MRVWLINSSEAAPTDSGGARLRRTGLLANALLSRGHHVVWWTSTFHHVLKEQRFQQDAVIDYSDRYRLRFLHAPAYHRNVSISRLWNHYVLGRKLRRYARTELRPDVILCSYPTLELSAEAVRYGKEFGVPVVLDVRDMWPDIFLDLAPRWARWPCSMVLQPMFNLARRTCAGAFAISGHAPAFVEWGIRCGNRRRTQFDRDFPFGYATENFDKATVAQAERFWRDLGVPAGPDTAVVCFVGAINDQFDLDTVIRAARQLRSSRNIQFVLGGAGVRLDSHKKAAADCSNIVFPGWVNAAAIRSLLQMSRLALMPYVRRPDYEASIPNKAIEYLSGGVPVLTSVSRGIFLDLLRERDCGTCYDDDRQLAKMIDTLCSSPQRLNEMAGNASRLFLERFTADRVYGEMADHLLEIAAAGRS